MTTLEGEINLHEKYKELMGKKKKVTKKMDGLKKKYVVAKIEKKRINQEIARIAAELKRMFAEDPKAAKEKILKDLTTFNPEDLFPADLEKEFDNLELTRNKKDEKMVELNDYIIDGDSVVAKMPDEDDVELHERQISLADELEDLDKETRERLIVDSEVGFDEDDIIVGESGERPVTGRDLDAD